MVRLDRAGGVGGRGDRIGVCAVGALSRPRSRDSTTLVFVVAGLSLTLPHQLARPHVLAFPLLIAWIGG